MLPEVDATSRDTLLMPHTCACDLSLLRALGVQQLQEGSEMAQMPRAHVLLTLGM